MRVFTIPNQIETIAERWKKTYCVRGKWSQSLVLRTGYTAQEVYKRLCDLPDNATSSDVAAIIGHNSWINLRCHECQRYVSAVVQLGEEPDYESSTADICFDCLQQATSLLEREYGPV